MLLSCSKKFSEVAQHAAPRKVTTDDLQGLHNFVRAYAVICVVTCTELCRAFRWNRGYVVTHKKYERRERVYQGEAIRVCCVQQYSSAQDRTSVPTQAARRNNPIRTSTCPGNKDLSVWQWLYR